MTKVMSHWEPCGEIERESERERRLGKNFTGNKYFLLLDCYGTEKQRTMDVILNRLSEKKSQTGEFIKRKKKGK